MSRRTAHYVVSTHWDREWYESFQDYRFRLVHLLDEVLDTMRDRPGFRYFQMDGQSIPIEDYLEVRPERAEQVRSLAAEGRLRIGPWYVLPDEFLVGGESIIRNIRLGLDVAADFGTPSRTGFVCDLFGHISQLPQILRGFGIDNALLWRGTNEATHGAMFRWQAPDGSEVIAYRFSPKSGYCSYAFKVRKCHEPDVRIDVETALEGLRELVDFEKQRCPTDALLLFDGGDHMEIEPATSDILERANAGFEDVEIIHSHLDGFIEDLREQRDRITRTFVGELRDPALVDDDQWVIPGVLSSRVDLKQANARCEAELCLWAEPFSVFAAGLGHAYPHRYLELAWRHLIQNHPHDSICGCSIDQVHRDMRYRFDQSRLIASHVTREALEAIAARVQVPELGEKDVALVVFNPSADAVDGPVDLTLRFPSDIDTIYQEWFGFEPKVGFRLYDAGGEEVPYQYVAQRRERVGFRRPLRKFPAGRVGYEIDMSAPLAIPAYGYTVLLCRPIKEPTRHLGSMRVDDRTIENEHLRVAVESNGSLRLTDRRTGETYDGLLRLEDRADIGDGWYHGTAVNDQIHSSTASRAEVALVADGIARATLRVRVTMRLPRRFEFGSLMKRSDDLADLVVTHDVTLRRGSDAVEVESTVDNSVRDHRLRVLFPTGCEAVTYLADQAFDVVERPIALRTDNARYKEMEVETKPQQTWTAVFDDQRGLAVISTGLYESAACDLPDRPIALTLLRSFTRTVLTSGQEDGEIQGRHVFRYQILPLAGVPDASRLTRLGQRLAAGVRAVEVFLRDTGAQGAPARELPPVRSFLEVSSPQPIITAVHRVTADEAATIRLYNPTPRAIAADLKLADWYGPARMNDLEGRAGETLNGEGGTAPLKLDPKRIVTVQFAG